MFYRKLRLLLSITTPQVALLAIAKTEKRFRKGYVWNRISPMETFLLIDIQPNT
ncbi:exported hypothetical protein [Capnocytophaga canis]|uniref:Uncharacterized protein n=1 Tax=Capnocytophaga canis TaxID=1848903 RepID=A0A0B7IU73_9FLAO|nr:exported hypothetical protein [Capnocytophaga canis]CEN53637.1 exported hypothetical protein [Capnocytophaga canis]